MGQTPDKKILGKSAALQTTAKPNVLSGLSSNQLLVAAVSGFFIVIAAGVTGYFARPVPDPPPQVTYTTDESTVPELLEEIAKLRAENESLRASIDAASRNPFVESFVIPNGKFMGLAEKNYIISVNNIENGVAEMMVKWVHERTGFEDRKFVSKGSILHLASEDVECVVNVGDVLSSGVNLETKCLTPKAEKQ